MKWKKKIQKKSNFPQETLIPYSQVVFAFRGVELKVLSFSHAKIHSKDLWIVVFTDRPHLSVAQVAHAASESLPARDGTWAANNIVTNKGDLYHDNDHHDDHDECAIICIRCHYHHYHHQGAVTSPVSTCLLALQCNLIGILPVHQQLAFLRSHLICWSFPNQIRSFEDGRLLTRTQKTHTP